VSRGAVLALGLSACGFSVEGTAVDAAITLDAGPCTVASTSCATDTLLRSCVAAGAPVVETTCAWGCLDLPTSHCAIAMPAGGVITSADLDGTGLGPGDVGNTTINGSDGSITGVRMAGPGIKAGIYYELRATGAVFRFSSLALSGVVRLAGDHPIVLVASDPIVVEGTIDGRGDPVCIGRTAGPGGFAGGDKEMNAAGSGGGSGTATNDQGGGGGGHGAVGGSGGAGAMPGTMFGTPTIDVLRGGGGGGGGGGGW
jgi:hypothetical protein